MKSALNQGPNTAATVDDSLAALLDFGAAALRAGNTASRTRDQMKILARSMGFDAISVSLSLDSITVAVQSRGERAIAMRDVGPAAINSWRIDALEQLANAAQPGISSDEVAPRIAQIESTSPLYSHGQIAAAIGLASAGFAFLNGSAVPEMIAAGIGGGVGQWSRSWLLRRRLNHYAVAALTAVVASGIYVTMVMLETYMGLAVSRHPAGFMSSVLFLVPGFPLIAALFDLLQDQTVAAVSRLAHGVMILLVVAFGLSIIIEIVGVNISPQPSVELAYALKLLLRAVASFTAACAFAMLFNNPIKIVLAIGALAVAANDLRLLLHDLGMMLAPAAFFAALLIGVVASLLDRRFNVARITMAVPPVIIMVPGLYAFQMLVLLNRGEVLEALEAAAACGFIIGGLAMGLAAARLLVER